MNEELRMQRVERYGSFLYCPMRDTLCFGRYTDKECAHDSCFLDDTEYQALQKRIEGNRRNMKREKPEPKAFEKTEPTEEQLAWKEVYKKEAMARKLYRKNKPKIADGLMADAMYMRRTLIARKREENHDRNHHQKHQSASEKPEKGSR